jgi:CheY-like chemotaxis protein
MPTTSPNDSIDGLTAGAGDILVVDDNPANLIAIEAALGDLAGSLVKVRAGEEALRALLRQDFALILLDVQMPTMDGFETARLVRTRGRSKHTPIIFITAYGQDQEGVLRGYELGAVDFLFKPIVPEVLRAKVTVFVELRRRTAEVTRQAELLREHERREHERQLGAERQRWEAELLRRENRELEDADRRKNEFLAMLAHELRTPLSPVVMGLDILRGLPPGDPGAPVVIDAMERQLHHLTRLVDDLLEVARITRGSIELRRRAMPVQDAVQQAVAMCQVDMARRNHTLTVELPEVPVWVEVDPVRLTQVVCNLLTNAARYTDPGGDIRVACRRDGEQVYLEVRDNGRGIAPDALEKIFDMFVQGEGSGGLGLGLALVRRLVEMHGGRVSASSGGAGRGSEFLIRLPVAAAPVDGIAVDSAPLATPPAPVAVSRRIVIVEDHEDIRELLAEALRRRGHNVMTTTHGEEGARAIAAERPEVALIDIGLPDIDGLEVARRARAAVGDSTRLVAMTGFGQASVKQRALAAGFDEFLVKPIQVGTIERLLAGPSASSASTSASSSSLPGLAAVAASRPRSGSQPPSASRARVLVVEDDEDTSSVLCAALARDGYDVEVAHDGEQAVDRARSWQPAVVLCDLTLPGGLGGLEVARALRADARTQAARLVAVTGHSRAEDRRAATDAGFDDYLTKPLTLAAVKAAVARSLAQGDATAVAET